MGIAFAHDITLAGRFVNSVADGIARRNLEFAQQQDGGGGKVFAMPAAAVQQEPAQRRLVGAVPPAGFLPKTVAELVLEKTIDRPECLRLVQPRKFHFRNHLVQRGPFVRRHKQIPVGGGGRGIQGVAGTVTGVEDDRPRSLCQHCAGIVLLQQIGIQVFEPAASGGQGQQTDRVAGTLGRAVEVAGDLTVAGLVLPGRRTQVVSLVSCEMDSNPSRALPAYQACNR